MEDFAIGLRVGIFLVILMTMAFGSLTYSTKSTLTQRKLKQFKHDIGEVRNKFHVKLFWDKIQSKDFNEARRLYNHDTFITGSFRALCNGILMGLATQVNIDNDWDTSVYERMDSYLK